MNNTPLFVTYWWSKSKNDTNKNTTFDHFENKKKIPKTFLETTEQLKKDVTSKGLDFYYKRIPHGDYQTNINFKPQFIKECVLKFKRPIVYMDNDLRMYKIPQHFLKTNNYDFMALNWNTKNYFETAGPLFYFNHTESSLCLLDEWIKLTRLKKFKGKADDRLLVMAYMKTKAYKWCVHKWLGNEYLYFPAYFDNVQKNKVVICHPYLSTSEDEAHKLGSCKNRIPQGYDKTIVM
jgi:hypothetical protein